MKSGTTYLNGLLHSHPDIFMSHPEEPSYFVDPDILREDWPYMWDKGYWKSEENYLQLFDAANGETWLGEASTNYTKLPRVDGVVERLQSFNPDARLIYLMRDPIERTISHYWHMVRYHYEPRKPMRAITEDDQFVAVSNYPMQLKPYIEAFGSERVLAITYEELVANARQVLPRVFEWLGIDSDIELTEADRPKHVTPDSVEMPSGTGLLYRIKTSDLYQAVHRFMPNRLRRVARGLAVDETRRSEVPMDPVIDYLRGIQRPQVEELGQLLGRDFPEWTTVHGHRVRS